MTYPTHYPFKQQGQEKTYLNTLNPDPHTPLLPILHPKPPGVFNNNRIPLLKPLDMGELPLFFFWELDRNCEGDSRAVFADECWVCS